MELDARFKPRKVSHRRWEWHLVAFGPYLAMREFAARSALPHYHPSVAMGLVLFPQGEFWATA